jgi:hypothetical protein
MLLICVLVLIFSALALGKYFDLLNSPAALLAPLASILLWCTYETLARFMEWPRAVNSWTRVLDAIFGLF